MHTIPKQRGGELMNSRIKAERALAKVSQRELAYILEVAPMTVAKWEADVDKCPVGKIKQIAAYFDCNVDYLIGISETRR